MEEARALISELQKILANLKKAPTRKYRQLTLKQKLTKSRDLYYKTIECCDDLVEEIQTPTVKLAREVFFEITQFLNNKLQYKTLIAFSTVSKTILAFQTILHSVRKNKKINMAQVDIKLGTSLVATYDGNSDQLDTFIESVQLFTELTENANAESSTAIITAARALVVRFVKTRLTGVAHQTILGCDTVESIISTLQRQCQSKESSESLNIKIKNLKQTGPVVEFCTQVENMCVLLKNTYIKETIPEAKAKEMSTKVGVSSLINGINDPTTKLILKAGNFEDINSAVQKILENNNTDQTNQQIFYTNHFNKNNARYNKFNRPNNYRNNSNNYNSSNNNHGRFNSSSNRVFNNTQSNSRYNNSYRYNRNNNNNRYNNSNRHSNRNGHNNNNGENYNRNTNNNNNNNTNRQQRPNRPVMVANTSGDESFFQTGTEPSIQ